MIVGAPKSGTTSLKDYLGQHPGICTHRQTEMQFFANDIRYAQGYERMLRLYFPCAADDRVLVAKNVAMMYSPRALDRLARHNPAVHVVVLLRDPVERAYSEYWYARRRGWEPRRSFEAALRDDGSRFGDDDARRARCAYLERSTYARHVRRILERFGGDRTHVLLTDDLRRDAAGACRPLFALFPGLDPDFSPRVDRRANTAALPRSRAVLRLISSDRALPNLRRALKRLVPRRARDRLKRGLRELNERRFDPPPMAPELRARLVAQFRPHNRELAGLLGRDLRQWDSP